MKKIPNIIPHTPAIRVLTPSEYGEMALILFTAFAAGAFGAYILWLIDFKV